MVSKSKIGKFFIIAVALIFGGICLVFGVAYPHYATAGRCHPTGGYGDECDCGNTFPIYRHTLRYGDELDIFSCGQDFSSNLSVSVGVYPNENGGIQSYNPVYMQEISVPNDHPSEKVVPYSSHNNNCRITIQFKAANWNEHTENIHVAEDTCS